MTTINSAGQGTRKLSPDPPAATSVDEYTTLRQRLVRAVRQVCPRWLADQSEDIVQVAMLRVMKAQKKNSEGFAQLSASYLWKAAYSATVDEIRARRRRDETSLDDPEGIGEVVRDVPDPEEESRGREIGVGIRDCLSLLVRPRRLAVTLRLQEHSIPEIGRLMGWGSKRAENLVYRGLDDLRQCLTSKGLG